MSLDVWPVVHAERAALVRALEPLTDEQWETASLCEGWAVHGEDVRRNLGLRRSHPDDASRA